MGEATAKRGSVGRRFRHSHRTAAVVIASAEKPLRTAVGGVVADKPRREGGAGLETAAANEVTGLPQGVSLLWTRPRPQKGGEQGPAVVIRRKGCGRGAAEEVAGKRGGVSLGCCRE